jgi:regulator of replication initiation timing
MSRIARTTGTMEHHPPEFQTPSNVQYSTPTSDHKDDPLAKLGRVALPYRGVPPAFLDVFDTRGQQPALQDDDIRRASEKRDHGAHRIRTTERHHGKPDGIEPDRLPSCKEDGRMAPEAVSIPFRRWFRRSIGDKSNPGQAASGSRSTTRELEDKIKHLQARNREFRDKIETLEKQNTDLSNVNAKLRERIEQHDTEIDERVKMLEEWKRYLYGQRDEIDQFMRDNEQLKRDLGSQCGEIDRLRRENERLQRDLCSQRVQMQQQRADFLKDLDAIRSEYYLNTRKIPDTTIRKNWEGLGFEIRQLVTEFLPPELEPQVAQQLAQLSDFSALPHAEDMLQDSWLCPMWFHAWIWHVLYKVIFKAESRWWAGRYGCRFSRQYDALYREFPS